MGDSWLLFWSAVVTLLLVYWIILDWKRKGSP
jgi:hypothetical protein